MVPKMFPSSRNAPISAQILAHDGTFIQVPYFTPRICLHECAAEEEKRRSSWAIVNALWRKNIHQHLYYISCCSSNSVGTFASLWQEYFTVCPSDWRGEAAHITEHGSHLRISESVQLSFEDMPISSKFVTFIHAEKKQNTIQSFTSSEYTHHRSIQVNHWAAIRRA